MKKLQNKREVRENNKAFTASILSLFERLSIWERQGDAGFELSLDGQSPSDVHDLDADDHRHGGEFVWDVRNEHDLFEFESTDISLPPLPCVSGFYYEEGGLYPSVLQIICNSLPFLNKTRWEIMAPGRGFPELQKATRFVLRK